METQPMMHKCVGISANGERFYEEFTLPEIADMVRMGFHLYHTHEWDEDPEWEDKAARISDEEICPTP